MNQRNRFNPLKPFYIYEMKNTNNFFSLQRSAMIKSYYTKQD